MADENKFENLTPVESPSIPETVPEDTVEQSKYRVEQEKQLERDLVENIGGSEGEGGDEAAGTGLGDTGSPYVNQQMEARKKEVEKVLADGLEDIYTQLTPETKKHFKIEGERTASQITLMLSEAKVKVKKVVELIRKWLMIIPGVNKYFLEQEAKIKTDKLLELKYKNE